MKLGSSTRCHAWTERSYSALVPARFKEKEKSLKYQVRIMIATYRPFYKTEWVCLERELEREKERKDILLLLLKFAMIYKKSQVFALKINIMSYTANHSDATTMKKMVLTRHWYS